MGSAKVRTGEMTDTREKGKRKIKAVERKAREKRVTETQVNRKGNRG